MKSRVVILSLLLLPFIISGCVKKDNEITPPNQEPVFSTYSFEGLSRSGYKVKYPAGWQVEEKATGKFGEQKNQTIFTVSATEEISVTISSVGDQKTLLDGYAVESQSQTQIDSLLADDYLVQKNDSAGERWRMIMVVNGKNIFSIACNNPSSEDFDSFINSFNFVEYPPEEAPKIILSPEVKLKLYFDDVKKSTDTCIADSYQEVLVARPEVELGLIPLAVKSLIQWSIEQDLSAQGLTSAIPINTRLLSFGYENNTAIVNFNADLTAEGNNCQLLTLRSQIEKTIKALNNVSNIKINFVEIQVENEKWEAPQP